MQAGIETWNALAPTTGNCKGALLWEQGNPIPGGVFHAETTLFHELGHCGLGLAHINLGSFSPLGPSSFTKSVGATSITDGNGIIGDFEDVQAPATSVQDLSWFRKSDNDPFVIDATVIDINTFSRSVAADLPAGHNYAASANKFVAQANSLMDTQSIMYGRTVPGMINTSLVADDVNTVQMGMTGADLEAGTPDDYEVRLRYQANCSSETEIEVSFASFLDIGVLGSCRAEIATSFPQGLLKFHWTLIPSAGNTNIKIYVTTLETWDFGDRLFSSGFENGDTSEWSDVSP